MELFKRFLEYSAEHRLTAPGNRLLVAVSGGIDSMVLAWLIREAGISHAIAHCNFSLRDKESDDDEIFVSNYAGKHNIPFYSRKFDTVSYAASKGLSIQMAARELRYEWFDELVTREGFDAVAVAHNRNDNAETFFINLLRGTGLNGLTGMSQKYRNIIRPLLFATRDEIVSFARQKKIKFREDSSNSSIKYTRNRIRHKILPEFEKVNPNALAALSETISHLRGSAEIIDRHISELRLSIFRPVTDGVEADIKELKNLQPASPYIFELFRVYGLSAGQTCELISLLDSSPGKYINTNTHRLLRDRQRIIITERVLIESSRYEFHSLDEMHMSGIFSDMAIAVPGEEPLPSCRMTACLDLDKVTFPVIVRRWEPGDRFVPLGMSQPKKISDFLIDLKVPVTTKEKVLLLLSADEVIWVMGYRINERYKVTDHTTRILMLTI
ncbi:MAG: tRNA lysidine(34) synthetase TilS [Bacteroidales bacterium]|nr:tRNA lysidine(34) synthetase TilS [Bacteroidales bacterium]